MWKTPLIATLLLSLGSLAHADGLNGSTVLGAGLGAAAGAAVGSVVGGQNGAVLGGAIGGAAGAAIGGNPGEHRRPPREVVVQPAYAPVPVYRGERGEYRRHEDRGWHRGHWEHGRGWGPPGRDRHDD